MNLYISKEDVTNVLNERLKILTNEDVPDDEEVKVILDALDYYAPIMHSAVEESYINFVDRYL